MDIHDVMDRRTARIHLGRPMRLAAEILVLTQAGYLMVVDDADRFVGVLSEGDLLHAIMPDFEGLTDSGTTLAEAYQIFLRSGAEYADQPVDRLVVQRSIKLKPDDELLKAATVMLTKRTPRLPVIDGEDFVGASRARHLLGASVRLGTALTGARLNVATGAATSATAPSRRAGDDRARADNPSGPRLRGGRLSADRAARRGAARPAPRLGRARGPPSGPLVGTGCPPGRARSPAPARRPRRPSRRRALAGLRRPRSDRLLVRPLRPAPPASACAAAAPGERGPAMGRGRRAHGAPRAARGLRRPHHRQLAPHRSRPT